MNILARLSVIALSVFIFSACGADKYAVVSKMVVALDSLDPQKTAELYSEDSILVYGNAPAVTGKEAIYKAQKDFSASIKDMRHTVKRVWEEKGVIAAQMTVTYQKHDGSYITLPVTDVFTMKDGKITGTYVYMDVTPLFKK